MTDPRIAEFAKLLAETPDSKQFDALIARARMLAVNSVPDEAFKAPIRTLGDYLDAEIKLPPELISPYLLVRGSILTTVGRAGKGKTQMNLNRKMRLACGKPLFDTLVAKDGSPLLGTPEPRKILIIENEGAAGMFHRQIGIMLNAPGRFTDDEKAMIRENILIWGDGGYSGLKLDEQEKVDLVRAGCEEWEPDILFIEPFRGLWKGEENSSTDMNVVMDALSGIATTYDLGVILTHHEKKGNGGDGEDKMDRARGSSVLEGHVATMENFESVKGGDYRELSYSKMRYCDVPVAPIRMEWQVGEFWYNHVPNDETEQAILDVLAGADDPMSTADVSEATEEKPALVRKVLSALQKDGRVKQMASVSDGRGSTGHRWRLVNTDEGGGLSI